MVLHMRDWHVPTKKTPAVQKTPTVQKRRQVLHVKPKDPEVIIISDDETISCAASGQTDPHSYGPMEAQQVTGQQVTSSQQVTCPQQLSGRHQDDNGNGTDLVFLGT